jgi:hypothetical protein
MYRHLLPRGFDRFRTVALMLLYHKSHPHRLHTLYGVSLRMVLVRMLSDPLVHPVHFSTASKVPTTSSPISNLKAPINLVKNLKQETVPRG